MSVLTSTLAVGIGAALGAVARWVLGLWLHNSASTLPWGTLAANLVGAYLIGVVLGCFLQFPDTPAWLRLFVTTGFLGGLTTFSTFSAETISLLERGHYAAALGYTSVSILGALALTAVGLWTVQILR